jgi:hypothetical protein
MRMAKLMLMLLTLLVPAIARAAPQAKSLDEIHATLEHAGEWITHDHWGSVWSPHDAFYRPYSRGHWTVEGTTWTYHGADPVDEWTAHYGYWIDDPLYGWIWKAEGNWRSAAVAWRMGDHHVGWAPLDPNGNVPKNPVDWVFVKGVDAVAEKLAVVALPPIAAADLFDKTRPLTTPPTEMAVLDLPEPSFLIDDERMASTERTTM